MNFDEKFIVKINLLFCFFCFFSSIYSQDISKKALWKGNFKSIYQNQIKIEIDLAKESYFKRFSEEQILKTLKRKKTFPIIKNRTKQEVGTFSLIYLYSEKNKIILMGKAFFFDRREISTTNYFITEWKEIQFYQDPDIKIYPKPILKSIFYRDKEMVYIPEGEFLYGQGEDSSQTSFNSYFYEFINYKKFATTKAFYIDKHEVTNEEYAKFLKQTNTKNENFWKNSFYDKSRKYHPVIYLSYRESEKYAKWIKKRIPTEWEWEKAARGIGFKKRILEQKEIFINEERAYPFGDSFDSELCNTLEANKQDTLSIYALNKNSASPWGVMGMCGNASEWTSSYFRPYPFYPFSSSNFGKFLKVIRGGSFSQNRFFARVFHRDYGGLSNLREDRRAGLRLVIDPDKI